MASTFALTLAVGAEYIAENPKRIWWAKRKHAWAIVIVISLGAEMLTEGGAFIYSSDVSEAQQKKIIALETRLAARVISPAVKADMTGRLRGFGGQSFEMVSYSEDPESVDLASEIGMTLTDAGWSPKRTAVMGIGEVIAGVVVYVNDDAPASAKEAADALVATLNANHIVAVRRVGANNETGRLKVTVGIKP
jgi:hypothetical protein